jgi:hypothetical protein
MLKVLSARRFAGMLLLVVSYACGGPKPPPPRNAHEAAAVDTLVHLLRKSLSEKDPAPTFQAAGCEVGVIYDEFGETRGDELIAIAQGKVHTWRTRAAERRLDDALAGHVFHSGCAGRKRDRSKGARADSEYIEAHRSELSR